MRTGELLDSLISISGISKTDYAISVYTTPSGLSFILSGKRLPRPTEKKTFCQQSASVLAAKIFEPQCYRKLIRLFPIIYDFHSLHELEAFLQRALEYALEQDWAVANKQNLDYPDYGKVLLGDQRILNTFCIALSEYILRCPSEKMVLYSSLPLFGDEYPPFLRRLRFECEEIIGRVSLYQAIPSPEENRSEILFNPLNFIRWVQDHCDLNFWQAPVALDDNFLLLKDCVLVLFDKQFEGSWSMTLIDHKSFVQHFFQEIESRESRRLSFNREHFLQKRNTKDDFLDYLLQLQITDVFNFAPTGYTVTDEELSKIESSADERQKLLAFFEKLLSEGTNIFFSDEALRLIANEGKVVIPFHGTIDIPSSERIPFLKRVVKYTVESAIDNKFQLIYSSISDILLLCSAELSIIYTTGYGMQNEKVHLFFDTNLGEDFKKLIENEALGVASFSIELWEGFLQQIE